MKRFLAAALLTCTLSVPLVLAQDHQSRRYYDKTHKDYHEWNDNENRSFETFRSERHIKSHDFAHAKKSEQQQYWNWRHEHPDDNNRR